MIDKSILVRGSPARAFSLFTERASAWWPPSRRHLGDPESQILLQESGRFWERSNDGREVDLGRVRSWEPPSRLLLDFYVGTDAQHPTEVEVTFEAEGESTRVRVQHRPTALSIEPWTRRNAAFEASWSLLLPAFASFSHEV